MNKKTLTLLLTASLSISNVACTWTTYGAETESSMDIYVEDVSSISDEDINRSVENDSADDVFLSESIIDDEPSGIDSFGEEYHIDTESDSEIEEDIFGDEQGDSLEDIEGIIDQQLLQEGILYAASEATELEEEFEYYNLFADNPYYIFKPTQSGIYYFAGDISEFSALDPNGERVKWTEPINPLLADGKAFDESLTVVAAKLNAHSEYELTIKGETSGSFYYYKAPPFCVKFVASTTAEDELLQDITYLNRAGGKNSFQAKVYPLVQSAIDSKYYFLTYNPNKLPGEPIDNGDGTYAVDLYDYFTGKQVGHSRDQGKVVTPATCARQGVIRYTCIICGKTFNESIPKTSTHAWSAYNANGDRTCSVCNLKQHDASKIKKEEPVYYIAGKPSKVKVKAIGNRKLTVTWKLPAKSKLKKIKGYYIEVATDKSFTNIVRTRRVKKSRNTFTFKKLMKGQRYFVRVRFYKGTQFSRWSSIKYKKVK